MSALRPELAKKLAVLFPGARVETLPADASTRRFHRLRLPNDCTHIVMDYGAAFEGEPDDVKLARVFEQASLPVARVLEILPDEGALVLEDLGDDTLEAALAQSALGRQPGRQELYHSAVRLAADIATRGTEALLRSDRAPGPALDRERFLFEMRFFLENYVGHYLGRGAVPSELREAVDNLAVTVAAHPRVLCHRDYHSRNIMVRARGALAMVDIQDARWGPDTYDLASLLRDAYVDLGEAEVDELFSLYIRTLPGTPDVIAVRERFNTVAIQRMVKALGTFGYQVAIMKRERYQAAIPPTVDRLKRLVPIYPATAPIARYLD